MLALACVGQALVVMDASIVNVALPSVQQDLGLEEVGLQWVVSAYALAFAGVLLLGGRLGDALGARSAFVLGTAVFATASLLGGLASTGWLLIASRAAQGLGAGVLAPATMTVLTTSIPEGAARTRAVATWTAVSIAGGTIGNIAGGLLTEAWSWRWTLLVNVPVCAATAAVAWRVLPATRPDHRVQLRWTTSLALAGAMAGLAFGLTGTAQGWGALLVLAGSLVALVLLTRSEARRGADALIPARLLSMRAVALGNVAMLVSAACLMPMWFYLSLLMQRDLGLSPLRTGLGFLPHTVVGMVVAPRLMAVLPRRVLLVGSALTAAAGFAWQGVTAGAGGGYASTVLGPGILMSIGSGLFATPLTVAVTSGVHEEDAGAASGLMNTAKQFGGVLGMAVVTALAASAGTPGTPFWTMAALMVLAALMVCALPQRTATV